MIPRHRPFIVLVLLGTVLLASAATVSADRDCTRMGTLEGTAGPELAERSEWNSTDSFKSVVYHCRTTEGQRAFVRGTGSVGPGYAMNAGRIELAKFFHTETAWVFYHERGHNLRLGHTDGIMDYDQPDADPSTPLAWETKLVANHTEGLHYVNWQDRQDGSEMLLFLLDEWRADRADTDELLYALDRWRNESGEDVYADNTIVEKFDSEIPSYADTEERSVVSNAFYRTENTAAGEPWR